ncbi:MAG: sugar ABC transporter substrate-binding protein [Leucobacter sp.]
MKKNRVLIAGVAVLSLGLGLVGCSSGSQGGDAGSEGKTVGISAQFMDDPFQVAMYGAVEDTSKELGFKVLPLVNADFDLAKQLTDIRSLLDQGAQGIFASPADEAGMAPALQQAEERGAPFISVGATTPGAYISVVSDNTAMAEANCEYLGEAVGGKGTILMTIGPQEVKFLAERRNGFTDCIGENFPEIKVKEFLVGPDSQKCYDSINTGFSSESDVVGIFTHSDAVCGTAVPNALKSLGKLKPEGEDGHIYWGAIDGSPDGLQAVRDGYLDFLASQPAAEYGSTSAEWMEKAFTGEEPKVGETEHGSEVRDIDGSLVDVIPFVPVTKDNVDDSSLWGNSK